MPPKRRKGAASTSSSLSGKKFVFTGTLSTPRAEAKSQAEAAGAKVTGSVSKNTDILVAGPGAGQKIAAAERLGVEVWDEQRFLAAVGGNGDAPATAAGGTARKKARRDAPAPAPAPSPPPSPAPAGASLPAPMMSNIGTVNPVSGLEGKGHVLIEDGETYDADLAFQDAAANSNKFYRMQIVESNNKKKFWLVSHWGRIGAAGQSQMKEFKSKDDALKELNKKFKQKSGVAFADRATATTNQGGKYRTLSERRVAAAGGRIADGQTVCFCLSWDVRGVDLDIHCNLPKGKKDADNSCFFMQKKPRPWIELDVDKMGHDYPNQVENIFLKIKSADDGVYKYFVRFFAGPDKKPVPFQFTFNQCGKIIHEGKGIVKAKEDAPCVKLTMKGGKVKTVDFEKNIEVRSVPLE